MRLAYKKTCLLIDIPIYFKMQRKFRLKRIGISSERPDLHLKGPPFRDMKTDKGIYFKTLVANRTPVFQSYIALCFEVRLPRKFYDNPNRMKA